MESWQSAARAIATILGSALAGAGIAVAIVGQVCFASDDPAVSGLNRAALALVAAAMVGIAPAIVASERTRRTEQAGHETEG